MCPTVGRSVNFLPCFSRALRALPGWSTRRRPHRPATAATGPVKAKAGTLGALRTSSSTRSAQNTDVAKLPNALSLERFIRAAPVAAKNHGHERRIQLHDDLAVKARRPRGRCTPRRDRSTCHSDSRRARPCGCWSEGSHRRRSTPSTSRESPKCSNNKSPYSPFRPWSGTSPRRHSRRRCPRLRSSRPRRLVHGLLRPPGPRHLHPRCSHPSRLRWSHPSSPPSLLRCRPGPPSCLPSTIRPRLLCRSSHPRRCPPVPSRCRTPPSRGVTTRRRRPSGGCGPIRRARRRACLQSCGLGLERLVASSRP